MTFAEYDYDMDIAVQRQEAFEDGITIGEERGISRGAHDARIETARGMLSDNLLPKKIAKYTGLSLAEVQQLQIGMKAAVR